LDSGLGSVLVLLNFVAPRFAAVFEQSQMAMPTPTRIMLGASELSRRYGIAISLVPQARMSWA
jgi:type II secretory pathway component PulF